jgi:pimeloyl-ACP methyl ester carboxylesterase
VPQPGDGVPVVMVHGATLTGKSWETTPDGRMGWDEYFLRAGHPVYVIDQAWRGRSAANISVINSTRQGKAPADKLPPVFASSHESAWAIFRFGPEYPKVYPGMQFPVDAAPEFWKQMVPDWAQTLTPPNPTVPALSELAVKLDGTILMSHSQSGVYPFQVAALNTKGIAAIVSIEPGTCPSPTDDLKPYLKIPTLILWGDYVDLSSRWSPRLKSCKAFAEAAIKAGGNVQNIILNDVGMTGASHMLMQDRNSHQIADWLLGWIERNK